LSLLVPPSSPILTPSDVPPIRHFVPDFETLSYYDLFFNNMDNFLTPFPTTTNLLSSLGSDPARIKKCLNFAGTTRARKFFKSFLFIHSPKIPGTPTHFFGLPAPLPIKLIFLSNVLVIHSDVVGIIQKFLDVKKAHGSNRERQYYRGMTVEVSY
jgi:hypothetical protein